MAYATAAKATPTCALSGSIPSMRNGSWADYAIPGPSIICSASLTRRRNDASASLASLTTSLFRYSKRSAAWLGLRRRRFASLGAWGEEKHVRTYVVDANQKTIWDRPTAGIKSRASAEKMQRAARFGL